MRLCAKINYYVDFLSKSRPVFLVFFVLFQNFFFAQQLPSEYDNHSEPIIVLTNGATIYSQDESFNHQISKSENLQSQLELVETLVDGQLQIAAKNIPTKSEKQNPEKTLVTEEELLANEAQEVAAELPKKQFVLYINKSYEGNEFVAATGFVANSFVFPSNDFYSSKYFLIIVFKEESEALDYLHFDSYFYNSNPLVQHGCSSNWSVRPPPSLV